MHINDAIRQVSDEAVHQYMRDHPMAVRGLRNAQAFYAAVDGAVFERALSDDQLAALIRDGRDVERDTHFWTELVRVAGELVPMLITKFVV